MKLLSTIIIDSSDICPNIVACGLPGDRSVWPQCPRVVPSDPMIPRSRYHGGVSPRNLGPHIRS